MSENDETRSTKAVRTLNRLIARVRVMRRLNYRDLPVSSIADDSRLVQPGSLFVAIAGTAADGHDYISQAIERGACAVVCERVPEPVPSCPIVQVADSRLALSAIADAYYGSPSQRLCTVGVTGTDGKGSTAAILASILQAAGHRVGVLGSMGYRLGSRTLESNLTTPGPLALHRMLAQMVEDAVSAVCMEVSSHALVQHRARDVRFDAAILTNVTEDHLDLHGSIEDYICAKERLFRQLEPDAFAILNADSPVCRRFERATDAHVLTYGVTNWADVTGKILSMDMDGMRIAVRTPLESYQVHTALIGSFNCENVLAAATAAFAFGYGAEVVTRGLRQVKGVAGRLEKIRGPRGDDVPYVYVDYAHTPNALRRVLSTLKPLVAGKLVCVFGCGGERERQKRPVMGAIATELADLAVITSDNSRGESTESIIDEIVSGISSPRGRYVVEPDRTKAIELAIASARDSRSLVVVCGRGDERVQVIGERRMPLDDRVVAGQVLAKLPRRRKKSA